MGRAPWVALDGDPDGDALVETSLRRADVAHLAERTFPTLSGGERSRAALARVLAQDAGVLLLDEPTAALDLHHQEMVLRLARERAEVGVAVVVVLHDLGLAAAHADRIVVLDGGRVVVEGTPSEVLRPDLLSEVYRHPVEVLPHPRTGELIVLPVRADLP
jgi:iron complex transport system ATP-binding protein